MVTLGNEGAHELTDYIRPSVQQASWHNLGQARNNTKLALDEVRACVVPTPTIDSDLVRVDQCCNELFERLETQCCFPGDETIGPARAAALDAIEQLCEGLVNAVPSGRAKKLRMA